MEIVVLDRKQASAAPCLLVHDPRIAASVGVARKRCARGPTMLSEPPMTTTPLNCGATKDDHARQFHDDLAEQKILRAVFFLQ
jgi:hypothetical protein